MKVNCLAQEHNTVIMTRAIKPGPLVPESNKQPLAT